MHFIAVHMATVGVKGFDNFAVKDYPCGRHCDVQVQWMPLTSDHITSSEHWALTVVLRDDKTSSRMSEQLQTPVHSSIDQGRSTVTRCSPARSISCPYITWPDVTLRNVARRVCVCVCVCVCGNIRMRSVSRNSAAATARLFDAGSSLNGSIIRDTTFIVRPTKSFMCRRRHNMVIRSVERIQRHHQKIIVSGNLIHAAASAQLLVSTMWLWTHHFACGKADDRGSYGRVFFMHCETVVISKKTSSKLRFFDLQDSKKTWLKLCGTQSSCMEI